MPIEQVTLDKKLIFTVTAGRTGTAYLAKLLDAVPGVNAYHEPEPNFVAVMRRVQMEPAIGYMYLYKHKLPAILQSPAPVYAETSHLVCQGFIEPMVRMGLRPALILLRRAPRAVAWSYLERENVPTRSTYGIQYLLDPRDMGVVPLMHWEAATNYQLCFWFALEIERRQAYYAEIARGLGMTVIDVTSDELNDWTVFARMLIALGLPVTEAVRQSHESISRERYNVNPVRLPMPPNLDEEEEPIWDAVCHFHPLLRDQIVKRYG